MLFHFSILSSVLISIIDNKRWRKQYSTESASVEKDYDKFAAAGNYDATFSEREYVGPETA
jgi:hypothetical protein